MKAKTHNMLCMMLNYYYKSLGLFIQFVGKENILKITNGYDHKVFLPLFIFTYSFPNPNDASVWTISSAFYSIKTKGQKIQ
jgi:hypothetical protein